MKIHTERARQTDRQTQRERGRERQTDRQRQSKEIGVLRPVNQCGYIRAMTETETKRQTQT